MSIERYLHELGRALPLGTKRRVLAEAEDHLRESARDVGEEEALRRFGTPREVAARYRPAALLRLAAVALTCALGLAFLALYPIPENTLPPAPWAGDVPQYLHWKQDAVAQLFLGALALGLGGVVAWRVSRPRAALALGAGALAALVAETALGIVLAYQWQEAVPGAPGVSWIAAYALFELGLLALAVLLGGRAALSHN